MKRFDRRPVFCLLVHLSIKLIARLFMEAQPFEVPAAIAWRLFHRTEAFQFCQMPRFRIDVTSLAYKIGELNNISGI